MPPLTRRQWLSGALAAASTAAAAPVPASILVHEHILVDFIGAEAATPDRYDRAAVIAAALPHLKAVQALGCVRLHECTPAYLGRDPRLLAELADRTGLEIWTNTGYYAASGFKYLPAHVRTESAAVLARRWEAEFRQGIDGIRPRFLKIGVDKGPLPELSRKIVTAAGLASRETGLPLCSHTGDGAAALEQLEILTALGLPASRFIWVHAQSEPSAAIHAQVARAGAWVELDGISRGTVARHLEAVEALAAAKLLDRVLLSQDAGWYHVGEPEGGHYRGYTAIYNDFVPRLPAGWAETLLVTNPRRAFGA